MTTDAIETIARQIRKDVVRMHRIGSNVGGAMSSADILAVLYFDVMNIEAPDDPDRDRFVMSKGHCVSALYSALSQKGFLDRSRLAEYCADGQPLTGHPTRGTVPGIEVSSGSLGHGLPLAVGMAWSASKDGLPWRTLVLMGDGECQEGSVWEGAMTAARLGLSNLTVIVDANNLQGYGRCEDIQPVETLAPKFEAFGWGTRVIDGHDCRAISRTLHETPFAPGKPSAVIARTIKGKGIKEMEDSLGWHYFSVSQEKLPQFLDELDAPRNLAPGEATDGPRDLGSPEEPNAPRDLAPVPATNAPRDLASPEEPNAPRDLASPEGSNAPRDLASREREIDTEPNGKD